MENKEKLNAVKEKFEQILNEYHEPIPEYTIEEDGENFKISFSLEGVLSIMLVSLVEGEIFILKIKDENMKDWEDVNINFADCINLL